MAETALPEFIAKMFPYTRKEIKTAWGNMSFTDAGDEKAQPVFMVHGNPTWSFLYRKVIKELANEKFRSIAPDLIGFGTSDKPKNLSEHSLRRHGETLLELVEKLNLRDIILVVQDWGGPMALWMAAHAKDRVSALLLMNTAVLQPKTRFRTTPFHRFSHMPVISDFAFHVLNFPVPVMHRVQGNPKSISGDVKRAYAWPFRNMSDRIAPLALARMVPNSAEHPSAKELAVTDEYFRNFKGQVEFVWGTCDPILGHHCDRHAQIFPDARVTKTNAGHFLQEEVPDEIAAAIRRLAGKQA